ncbi:MAG: PEP-CTERM sorting domain-containing protein [Cyanobacteriota bacterium]|nr:PEP-CTERM sorting domain-containing protein [Cyanobacteriota bacterium]
MFKLNAKNFFASTATLAVALGTVAIAPQSATAQATFDTSDDNNHKLCDYRADCSLESLLDGIITSGDIDTVGDQSAVELFMPNASSSFTSNLMFEVAGNADFNEFGIYKKGSPGTKITLFDGAATPSSEAPFPNSATLLFAGNGVAKYNDTVYNDFGNEFGFFLKTKSNKYFYTEDALNENGNKQSVVYQGDGSVDLQIPFGAGPGNFDGDDWIIGFEDLSLDNSISDSDYNDFVILVSDLEAADIPEPATLAGLGLVAAAMAILRRRQNKKNS